MSATFVGEELVTQRVLYCAYYLEDPFVAAMTKGETKLVMLYYKFRSLLDISTLILCRVARYTGVWVAQIIEVVQKYISHWHVKAAEVHLSVVNFYTVHAGTTNAQQFSITYLFVLQEM